MVIELPELYPHQEDMRNRIRDELAKHRRAILCAPPGTGKTRMAKWILGSYANREKTEGQSGYSLFVVHRRGLVDNASNSFGEYPELPHGIIMSGRETGFHHSVHVASKAFVAEADRAKADLSSRRKQRPQATLLHVVCGLFFHLR